MNTRERILAFGVLGVLASVAAVFLFHQMYLVPLREREAAIQNARQEIDAARDQVRQIRAELPRLERWRQLSLPGDVDMARREYEKFLSELLRKNDFDASVTPMPVDSRTSPLLPGKKPIYTRLTFNVAGHGSLESLVTVLDRFYHTGLLHQVKKMSIQKPIAPVSQQKPTDLDVNMTIEALIVNGVGNRAELLPNVDPRVLAIEMSASLREGPVGMALAAWEVGPTGAKGPGTLAQPERKYESIGHKNIFLGPPPPKDRGAEDVVVSRFVYLTDVTQNDQKFEAFFFDRLNNKRTRIRNSAGFDSFRVTDGEGATIVQGKVMRITTRELVFKANDKFYVMHVGQNIDEAMEKSYPQMESLATEAPGPVSGK